ncbi:MAG: hypothetical protein AB7U64_22580 [Blastocatellales bacterium]
MKCHRVVERLLATRAAAVRLRTTAAHQVERPLRESINTRKAKRPRDDVPQASGRNLLRDRYFLGGVNAGTFPGFPLREHLRPRRAELHQPIRLPAAVPRTVSGRGALAGCHAFELHGKSVR